MSASTYSASWAIDLTRFLAPKDSAAIGHFLRGWMREALDGEVDDLTWLGLRTAGLILRARECLR